MNSPIDFIQPINLIIPLKEIGEGGLNRKITLTSEQRAMLAKELDLSSFETFECEVHLKALYKHRYELKAKINATLSQPSSVSLEPVKRELEEEFKTQFWPEQQNDPVKSPELEIDYIDEIIEFYDSETFDIGQIIYEQLVVALEQYPRGEGEVFQWESSEPVENVKPKPFAALKVLKDK